MWEDLLKIYNGVNEYFYFYNDYIEQIIDDNLKKKDLDSLKRKNDKEEKNKTLDKSEDNFSVKNNNILSKHRFSFSKKNK